MTLPDDEIEALLGAYALHAVDPAEAAAVERYLAEHPEAAREVERMAGAMDVVASVSVSPLKPPSVLWERIAEDLPSHADDGHGHDHDGADTDARPTASTGAAVDELAVRRAGRSRRRTWVLSVAAAVVVVALVAGGVVLARRGGSSPTDLAAAAAQAATQPGSRTGQLVAAGSVPMATVVVDREGHAYVTAGDMPPLPSDQTYQLWSVEGGTPVSVGLLGHDPAHQTIAIGVDGNVHQMAITTEPAGGSAEPTSTPVASGAIA